MWWVFFSVAWLCTLPLSVIGFIAVGRGYDVHYALPSSAADLVDVILNCILLIVAKCCNNCVGKISDEVGDSITMREFQGHAENAGIAG